MKETKTTTKPKAAPPAPKSKKDKKELTPYQTDTLRQKEYFLELGHLIKYNLYLNAKATVFAALAKKEKNLNPKELAMLTHEVLCQFSIDDQKQIKS